MFPSLIRNSIVNWKFSDCDFCKYFSVGVFLDSIVLNISPSAIQIDSMSNKNYWYKLNWYGTKRFCSNEHCDTRDRSSCSQMFF